MCSELRWKLQRSQRNWLAALSFHTKNPIKQYSRSKKRPLQRIRNSSPKKGSSLSKNAQNAILRHVFTNDNYFWHFCLQQIATVIRHSPRLGMPLTECMPNLRLDCTLLEAHLLNTKRGNQAISNSVCVIVETWKSPTEYKEVKGSRTCHHIAETELNQSQSCGAKDTWDCLRGNV